MDAVLAFPKERCCDPKRAFESRKLARQVARKTSRKVHLKTYKCPYCELFHNGRPEGFASTVRGKRYLDSQVVLDLPPEFLELLEIEENSDF